MSLLSFLRTARKWGLHGGLTLTYLFLVTPLGYLSRLAGIHPLYPKRDSGGSSGWIPTWVDSEDRELYVDLGTYPGRKGALGNWVRLIRAYRALAKQTSSPWKWLILLGIAPWAWASSAPKEAELSSDLYVLF